MIALLLSGCLGFSAAALVVVLSSMAGPLGLVLSSGGMVLGLLFIAPASGPRVLAFPRGPASGFALSAGLAIGVAAWLGGDLLFGWLHLVAGFMAGRAGQAAWLWIGVPKVARLPVSAALLTGVAVAPFALEVSGSAAPLVAALGPLVFAVLGRCGAAAALDLPAPVGEGRLAGLGSLIAVLLIGFGFGRLLPGSALGLLGLSAGAVVGALVAPNVRRSGVLLGVSSLIAIGALSVMLEQAVRVPRLAELDVRVAVAAFLFGLGTVCLPRMYAAVPLGLKVMHITAPEDRKVQDGATRRVALLVAGIAAGAGIDAARLTPRVGFLMLAVGATLSIWCDPRAGVGRKARVFLVAGAVAGYGMWMIRDVGW